jgi:GNAT superfamily N-acetyltransferase
VQSEQLPGLTFRPARPEDKPRMLEITARTFGDDGDYIPEVWERWLADPKGELTVAELDGTVIALAKTTWQGEGQWWLEGLRVDSDRRLKGIGQAMSTYQLGLIKRWGGGVVRYATGIRNEGSHRIAGRAGFSTLTRFVERVAEKLQDPTEGVEVLTRADLEATWNLARDSDLLRAANGVYAFAWQVHPLTRERLAGHLDQGSVMGVRDKTGNVCAWGLVETDPNWNRLGFSSLEGTTEGITALARALRTHAAALGKVMVEAMTTPHPRALQALEVAGYHLEIDPEHPEEIREHGIDILELRLDKA